ncbi:hypothetical protein [Sulfuricurvum sp.]|uniref:hypothetical protein n=1 Tax=Sulfuricurvum sp. TaxID=2025608 RepID=UPI00356436F7
MAITEKEWARFEKIVEAKAAAGVASAINTHKKECSDEMKEKFIPRSDCQTRRERCQSRVHSRIDNDIKKPKGKHVCADGENCGEEESAIVIHFKNNSTKYIVGAVVTILTEFILIVGGLLAYFKII